MKTEQKETCFDTTTQILIYSYVTLFCLFFNLMAVQAQAAELKSPGEQDKCFEVDQSLACVGHPLASEIDFKLDLKARQITAKARLRFRVYEQAQLVYFLLDPQVKQAWLNGQKITVKSSKTPGNEDKIAVMPIYGAAQIHELLLEYEVKDLSAWGLSWQPFHWTTDFSDSSDARFINAFAPASYEVDRYPMRWRFDFQGFSEPLTVFSSANIDQASPHQFELYFDQRHFLSSPYFDFTTQNYHVESFQYQGQYQPIAVTVLIKPGLANTSNTMADIVGEAKLKTVNSLRYFENTFGPYAYEQLLVKVYSLQSGDVPLTQEYSMEYGGAIVSRMELIPHEICHQWFGRGAAPADGQAGFVDEVICDWYDYDKPVKNWRLADLSQLVPQNRWTLRTPPEAYHEGLFMAYLAYVAQQQGKDIEALLSGFYLKYRNKNYHSLDFSDFLLFKAD